MRTLGLATALILGTLGLASGLRVASKAETLFEEFALFKKAQLPTVFTPNKILSSNQYFMPNVSLVHNNVIRERCQYFKVSWS